MNPNFSDMIRLAKTYGCSVNTTTNGTFFTEKQCAEIVVSGLDLVKVSLDGATRSTYQTIRGEDKFQHVIEGIQRLRDVKKRLNSQTPFIRLNYVLMKDNYHEMLDIIALSDSLGVDVVYFQPLELVGVEERQETLVGDLGFDNFSTQIVETLKKRRKYNVHTNILDIYRKISLYWGKYQMEVPLKAKRRCIMPWFSAYITVDGNVRPCCSFSQTKAEMGNLFEDTMQEIWNGERYQRLRKAFRKGKRPYPICENCVPQTLTDILKSSGVLPGFLK